MHILIDNQLFDLWLQPPKPISIAVLILFLQYVPSEITALASYLTLQTIHLLIFKSIILILIYNFISFFAAYPTRYVGWDMVHYTTAAISAAPWMRFSEEKDQSVLLTRKHKKLLKSWVPYIHQLYLQQDTEVTQILHSLLKSLCFFYWYENCINFIYTVRARNFRAYFDVKFQLDYMEF